MLRKLFGKKKNQNNTPEESVQEQTFRLETAFNDYTNEEISAQLLEEIINSDFDTWDFMVLEPTKPIKGSVFMQIGSPGDTDSPFCLEISFGSKMYHLSAKKDVVLQYLIAYYQEQTVPDISSWEDISNFISSPN